MPSVAVLLIVASLLGTGGVIAGEAGPPFPPGNAGQSQYKPPPCDRSFWERLQDKQRQIDRRAFKRSAADEREGPRLAAQGLEGCKG